MTAKKIRLLFLMTVGTAALLGLAACGSNGKRTTPLGVGDAFAWASAGPADCTACAVIEINTEKNHGLPSRYKCPCGLFA